MFLPIRADFHLPRFPILTVLVCLVCVGVFVKQQSDWQDFGSALEQYCKAPRSHIDEIIFDRINESLGSEGCANIMYTIANDPDRSEAEVIADMTSEMRPLSGFDANDSRTYATRKLVDEVRRYKAMVPNHPDQGLAYYTGSWNPINMVTASFSHGSWGHIIFNLVFFFAFAATVEVLIGPIWYLTFIVVDSLFIGVTGSIAATVAGEHYWTLGLSGIVMGMMGLFAYLLPKGKIKCYYFFIILFGSIAIPGWMLAAWYIGGNLFALFAYDDHGVVNVLAHVMGGVGGYFFGLAFLREIRKDAVHIQDAFARAKFEKRFR